MIYIVLYSALVLMYGGTLFTDSGVLTYLTGLIALTSVVVSFPKAKRLYQISAAIFLCIAFVLAMAEGISIFHYPYYMTSMVMLIMMFFVLPFINSVIIVGRYDQKVNKLLQTNISHLGQLYQRASMVSFLLGTFLNISTLPLVVSVLKRNLKEHATQLSARFITSAMLRGYALCLVWSPMEVLVAISVDITGVGYLELLPLLLFFSFTFLMITLWTGRRYQTYPLTNSAGDVKMVEVYKKIASLFFFLILFISLIIGLNGLLDVSFLETVALVIIPYSFLWALVIKRIRSFLVYGLRTWKARTSSLQNYIVLFLSVGFFISILEESVWIEYLQYPFLFLENIPVLLFFSIQVLFLGLAMVGFHPIVTITLAGEMVQPLLGSITPMGTAIVLITSGLSTVMAGPFNISVSLTGMLLHQNPYRVSLVNLGFAFLFSSGGTVLALILQYM
ncbi:hypothetical protein D7Z54_17240 [Salibacterium salarium]|uniref:Citrate transporter-like domain-containing protein n=1 Tax=Salibacterium salarium TaxID=284579 RepID=A0A428N190_9BACI|nr:hypothetical protein [Salibacterium salarium]RSL32170.1 hypothetical protein D7Z54_17240 [Salibacterium salarium]